MSDVAGARVTPGVVLGRTLKWTVLGFFLVFTFVPLLWLVISSFKTNLELTTSPFALPAVWQFQNYVTAFRIAGLFGLFRNSIIISFASTAITVLVTSMAAFVFAREKFPFSQALLSLILAGVLIPIIGLMAPYFRLINALGLYDTRLALILTYTGINLPIATYLMHGYMKSIPFELEEAAVIDGATFFQRFSKVVFPLSKSGLVTAGTFVFLFGWNEFIYALLLTSRQQVRTVQFGIRHFVHQFFTDYTAMFAAIVVTIVPSIVIYILFHERIVKGLTSGALKG